MIEEFIYSTTKAKRLKTLDCNATFLGSDIAVFDHVTAQSIHDFYPPTKPIKFDGCICNIVKKGNIECTLSMQKTVIQSPGLNILLPNRVMEFGHVSDSFEGRVVVFSSKFLENLHLSQHLMARISINHQTFFPCTQQMLEATENYLDMLCGIITAPDNPFRMEAASSLTAMIFYTLGYYIHMHVPTRQRTTAEYITDQFVSLLEKHCQQQHEIAFYANQLQISPKYLSYCATQATGKPALVWIQRYVSQEAKVLLGQSELTIQQIGQQLSFTDQVQFTKFYRRATGHSPSEYRKQFKKS